jgi:hypothetical protein
MTTKTKNQLVASGSVPALYQRMASAIADCFAVDDCREIARQAGAIAAYFKQINDDETVRKFVLIKIRAWRRIGELLVNSGVDRSACESTADYMRKIRAKFQGHGDIAELSESGFRQALGLAELPADFFERNAEKIGSIDGLIGAFHRLQRQQWDATPEGQAHASKLRQEEKQNERNAREREQTLQREQERNRAQQQERNAEYAALKAERDAAFAEVGVTLDRRDRAEMRSVVLLLKKAIHETLRQAAFDHRMTMQAILRAGLATWFTAHGYSVADDLKPQRPKRTSPRPQIGNSVPAPPPT